LGFGWFVACGGGKQLLALPAAGVAPYATPSTLLGYYMNINYYPVSGINLFFLAARRSHLAPHRCLRPVRPALRPLPDFPGQRVPPARGAWAGGGGARGGPGLPRPLVLARSVRLPAAAACPGRLVRDRRPAGGRCRPARRAVPAATARAGGRLRRPAEAGVPGPRGRRRAGRPPLRHQALPANAQVGPGAPADAVRGRRLSRRQAGAGAEPVRALLGRLGGRRGHRAEAGTGADRAGDGRGVA